MNVEYTQILIDRIRSLCSQWGYTITELAYQSGLKHSTVDNIINGRSFNPQIITLHKIAIAFNMTVDYVAIGARVKAERIRSHITQEKLAELTDLSVTHISNIECGHSKLSLPSLIRIANALNVSADDLLCDNVVHTKPVFEKHMQQLLEDCSEYEVRILTEITQAAKTALRRDRELKGNVSLYGETD